MRRLGWRNFSTRLLAAFLLLIVLTTLSTSLPAYWLTRRQLEQQAWQNVQNARQATLSLLQAEQVRLADLAQLFSERPTLQLLVRNQSLAELTPYLQDFQTQSDLDILLFCQDGRVLAGDAALTACIPLKVAGRVVGVLAVFRLLPHKLRLDAIDIDLFDVLAAHAASALLFTRLYAASGGIVGATA